MGRWPHRLGAGLIVLLGLVASACPRPDRGRPGVEHPPVETASVVEHTTPQALRAALRARGPAYVPRTRHLAADGAPKYVNRLILEASPYLLQHAHNPVDWFPWGEEAFARARALGRPIFLSVGYSTCHWCHVMEEESFEDEEIAGYLNEHYVAIKVDREERPDVDAVYLAYVQALTGGGGWPMSVWLTPARDPFFGGTYFPPRVGARGASQGFIELLRQQAERYAAAPARVASEARDVATRLEAAAAPAPAGALPGGWVLQAAGLAAARRFDRSAGGARGAPKFPSSFPLRVLLRIARRGGDPEARSMALATLDPMRAGGIYDQVGGGFHRYATDAAWRVPHFEKMLYDNAQLALVYLEAAQLGKEPRHAQTARDTLDYLLRDMQAPDGTFYAATDADSASADGRREEGVFFTWTPAELRAALGAEDARLTQAWLGVTDEGQLEGRSVLYTARSRDELVHELGLVAAGLDARLAGIRARLLARRGERPAPLRDGKVLVSDNALAIAAFARAAIVLGEARYRDVAVRAATALVLPFRQSGRLPHLFVDGRAVGRGYADDHALLAAALLDVFELTAEPVWLADARLLMEALEQSFSDPVHGGYYLTAAHHERLFLREKPDYDGPVPSASSVAALTWLRLYTFTDEERFRQRAETTLRAYAGALASQPLGLSHMLLALDWACDAPKQIVVVVPGGRGALAPEARPFLDVLQRGFVPNAVLVVASPTELEGELGRLLPWARGKPLAQGRATAYVCERGACKLPTRDPRVFAAGLAEARPYR